MCGFRVRSFQMWGFRVSEFEGGASEFDCVEMWGFRFLCKFSALESSTLFERGALQFNIFERGALEFSVVRTWGFRVRKVRGLIFPGPDLNSVR